MRGLRSYYSYHIVITRRVLTRRNAAAPAARHSAANSVCVRAVARRDGTLRALSATAAGIRRSASAACRAIPAYTTGTCCASNFRASLARFVDDAPTCLDARCAAKIKHFPAHQRAALRATGASLRAAKRAWRHRIDLRSYSCSRDMRLYYAVTGRKTVSCAARRGCNHPIIVGIQISLISRGSL